MYVRCSEVFPANTFHRNSPVLMEEICGNACFSAKIPLVGVFLFDFDFPFSMHFSVKSCHSASKNVGGRSYPWRPYWPPLRSGLLCPGERAGMLAAQGIASAAHIEQMLAMAQPDVDSSRLRCIAPFSVTFGQRVSSPCGSSLVTAPVSSAARSGQSCGSALTQAKA